MRLLVQRLTTSDATSMALASLLGPTWTGARRSQIPDVLADRPRPSCHLRSLILYAPGNGTAPLLLHSLPVGKLATTLNSAPALAPGRAPAACAPSTPHPRRSPGGRHVAGALPAILDATHGRPRARVRAGLYPRCPVPV